MYSVLPGGMVPEHIAPYVKSISPGVKFHPRARDRRDIEVELTNGLELTFDLNYNLIDMDD